MSILLQSLGQSTSTLGGGGQQVIQGQGQQNETYLPSVNQTGLPTLPPSRLEQIMSARAGTMLRQFGYDQLGQGRSVAFTQTGAVQDDYVLGLGDEIVVTLRGQENNEFRVTVDRNGQVMLPRLNPISAAGRTFGEFQADVQAAVKRAFVATTAFVAIGRVRQATVLVTGEVNIPGQRIVPGLSSVLDAIVLSGGIKKTGSLRNIRIERAGRTLSVDLYSMLTNTGSTNDIRLADGDHILVPILGKTVAVSGLVRRPAIYELAPSASSISARALMALAGGPEVRGQYRLSVLRVTSDGSTQRTPLANENGTVGDSEILFAQLGADQTVNQATLSGDVALAGQFPIVGGTKLSDVLKAPGALPQAPYTLFGIIARKDRRTLLRTLVSFTPVSVLNGSEDQPLQSDDIVRVLSVDEVRLLNNTVHLYEQRQRAEQLTLANPLSQDAANGTGQNSTANGGGTNNLSNLAEAQRRDIADLADQVDPVTHQALHAQVLAQQAQAAQRALELQGPDKQLSQLQNQEQLALQQQQQQLQLQQQQQQLQTQAQTLQQARVLAGQSSLSQPTTPSSAADGSVQRAEMPIPGPALNYQSNDVDSGQVAINREIVSFGDLARQLGVDQLVLINFLMDHQVGLDGAVNGPGSYFVGPSVPLQDLVQAAGGTANWADESGVELISTAVDAQSGRSATRRTQLPLRQGMLANYIVRPHDQLRFNEVFNDANFGTANVQGEVRFTGTYQITRGEHLSDLMARAGGLTSIAYPYGTVFLRKSAQDTERAGYIRTAAEVEEQLVGAMTHGSLGNSRLDAGTFATLQGFVDQLRTQKAAGRVTITADPSVLATRPEEDPLLEPGDTIYIPQRPSTVSVLGQVMQPGTMPYRPGDTVKQYIQMAGGYGPDSDDSNIFVVMPDGSARRVENSWFNFSSENLPPGSTIVVPRDLTPIDLGQLVTNVTSILSQLAVTTASLAVLSKQ
jgi:protein involved in polysaccharide export with SLBB domain